MPNPPLGFIAAVGAWSEGSGGSTVVLLGYVQSVNPVLAVAWLALFTDIAVRRLVLVLAGSAMMVVAGGVLRFLARNGTAS